MKPLQVGVIGCGFQGAIHARNVAASDKADLTWCVDLDVDRAQRLAAECGAQAVSSRPSDVWEDPAVDVVIIATTTDAHHDLALAAAGHGKHMLLEKPMALTVDECLAIERSCTEAEIVAVLGYKFRFTDAVVAAHQAVPEPLVLTAHTLYDPDPDGLNSWVNDRSQSGGRLVSSLVHSIDLLRFLSGDEVVRVFAEGAHIVNRGPSDHDTAVATLLFRSGCIGSIVHGTVAASGLTSTWSFQIASPGVNATIHDHGRRLELSNSGRDVETIVDPVTEPFEAGTRGLFEALAAAVTGDDVDVPGPRDGTLSLLVARAIEGALRTGQPVTIPSL